MSRVALLLLAGATLLHLGACGRSDQSVLAPAGMQAQSVTNLAWLLFGLGTLVLVLVVVAAALAIRGREGVRAALANERSVLALGVALPSITLTLLLGYGIWLMRLDLQAAAEPAAVRIEVVGEQWWWRVAYADSGTSPVATANEIRIPAAQPVEFILKATDVIHSFWIPNLGGKVDMIPGRATRLRLTATRPGIYRAQCAEYCGGPHALMALPIVVLPSSGYEAWLEAQRADAAVPASSAERAGQSLFLASGCGACHTVRGTAANGQIGPDLTHLGSRPSVGVDTASMTRANLLRFIVQGQHVKPGNRMPEYRIFSADEGEALATYLLSLR